MDPVIEQHYQQLLREWKKDDDSSKDRLDEIEGKLNIIVVCYTVVFSVVTQHSSPQTAPENRTTFRSRG